MRVEHFPIIVFAAIMAIFAMTTFLPMKNVRENKEIIGRNAEIDNLTSIITQQKFAPHDTYVLHVFASWCGACKRDLPKLSKILTRAKVYGLMWKDEEKKALQYHDVNPIYSDILQDKSNKVILSLGIKSLPETFIIGKDGKIIYSFKGPINEDIVTNVILPKIEQSRALESK